MKTILLLLPLLLTSCSEKPSNAAKCVLVVFIIWAVAVFIGLSMGYTSDDGGRSDDYADDEDFEPTPPRPRVRSQHAKEVAPSDPWKFVASHDVVINGILQAVPECWVNDDTGEVSDRQPMKA